MRARAAVFLAALLAAALCARPCSALPVAGAYPSTVTGLKEASALEREALARINKERGVRRPAALVWDARLSAVAREHSNDMATHGYFSEHSPRLGGFTYRLRRAGSSVPNAQSLIFMNSSTDDLMRQLGKADRPAHLGPATRIGVGIATKGLGQRYVTLILSETHSTLDPFPTRPTYGKRYQLSGRLEAGYEKPQVAMTFPDGTTAEREIALLPGRRFEGIIAFDRGKGKYVVELLAVGKLGPMVLDLMDCYSGVDYPAPETGQPGDTTPTDLRRAEREMLQMINAARAQAGLKPLTFDEKLAAVARGHSADMAANHFFAHVSPRYGDLSARMKRAGLQARAFTENLAQNRTLAGAHEGLMDSPGHRKNILDPRVSRVGIGIVRGAGEAIIVAQNFAQNYVVHDTAALTKEFLATLSTERAKKGAGPMTVTTTLTLVAEANAHEMKTQGKLGYARAQAMLRQKRLPYAVEMVVLRSTDPTGPDHWPKLFEDAYRRIGVGIAQSESADGRKDLWTTVLFAK